MRCDKRRWDRGWRKRYLLEQLDFPGDCFYILRTPNFPGEKITFTRFLSANTPLTHPFLRIHSSAAFAHFKFPFFTSMADIFIFLNSSQEFSNARFRILKKESENRYEISTQDCRLSSIDTNKLIIYITGRIGDMVCS